MEGELLQILEQIEREKGIQKDELLNLVENALSSAFKKHIGKESDFEAHIDPATGKIGAYVRKQVVKKVKTPDKEISQDEAKMIDPAAELGEDIKIEIEAGEFGRIAAQTAKQVIIQKIREVERENLYEEFKKKEGSVITGEVRRFIRKNAIVDLGKTEGILPAREQIRNQNLEPGMRIKVYVLAVEKTARGPQIIVSRTHPELVRSLFELEVPEVFDKTVEILQIVRDPGIRAKVAVKSHKERVDPVGACVGVKGSRVQAIISELAGERMDLIPYSDEIMQYIGNSLSPAKVVSVKLDVEVKNASVTVADDILSLAIGKNGQNVRLAARLTGWHIDVKSETQRKEEREMVKKKGLDLFSSIQGVGAKTAEILLGAGYKNVEELAQANPKSLENLSGIGKKTAQKIVSSAKKALKE